MIKDVKNNRLYPLSKGSVYASISTGHSATEPEGLSTDLALSVEESLFEKTHTGKSVEFKPVYLGANTVEFGKVVDDISNKPANNAP